MTRYDQWHTHNKYSYDDKGEIREPRVDLVARALQTALPNCLRFVFVIGVKNVVISKWEDQALPCVRMKD